MKPIKAICVPSINIDMNLPGLKGIAQAFVDKGYQLADSFLLQTDKISNLDLILGNLDSQLLPQKDILFGPDTKSVYAVSQRNIIDGQYKQNEEKYRVFVYSRECSREFVCTNCICR